MKKLLILPSIIFFSAHSMTRLAKRYEQHQKNATIALQELHAITPPELAARSVAYFINTKKKQHKPTEKEYSEYLKNLEWSCFKDFLKNVPPEKNDEICHFLVSKKAQEISLKFCDEQTKSANTFSMWNMIGSEIAPIERTIKRLKTWISYHKREREALGSRKTAGNGTLRKIKRVNKKDQILKEYVKALKKQKHQMIMKILRKG